MTIKKCLNYTGYIQLFEIDMLITISKLQY